MHAYHCRKVVFELRMMMCLKLTMFSLGLTMGAAKR